MISEENIRNIVKQVINQIDATTQNTNQNISNNISNSITIGSDHGGYKQKEYIKNALKNSGYHITDVGTYSTDSVDYPDFAIKVALAVTNHKCSRGIMLDGAGIGSCMAINKIKGCRAALCYNEKTILNSRLHNNANILTLGAPYHTNEFLKKMVDLWLNTDFEGGRHQKRIDKINALDQEKNHCNCN